jgi:YidC/Oxa1 family membrane protein insertase
MQIILTPFSWLLTAFYNLFHSYGFALILFAIVVKLILFPFSLKGKKSMIQMNMLNGKVQQIQKQYANNKEKMNEEVQKLYAKENVNPMGGCLWSFIPLLILWPLYAIIRRPCYYMMGQSVEAIQAIADTLGFVPTSGTVSTGYNELKLAGMVTLDNLESVKAAANSVTAGLGDKIFHINFNFLGLNLAEVPQWKFCCCCPSSPPPWAL